MWGGILIYPSSQFPSIYTAYEKIARNAASDPKNAQTVSLLLSNATPIALANLEYSDPTPWPPIFADWRAIPATLDGTGIANLSTLVSDLGGDVPDGIQETYWNHVYVLDQEFMAWSIKMYFGMLGAIADAPGLLPVLSFQAITIPTMRAMQRNGGNALGLDSSQGPIYICNLGIMWTETRDNDRIYTFANELYKKLEEEAGIR